MRQMSQKSLSQETFGGHETHGPTAAAAAAVTAPAALDYNPPGGAPAPAAGNDTPFSGILASAPQTFVWDDLPRGTSCSDRLGR